MKPRLNIMGRKHKIIQINHKDYGDGGIEMVKYKVTAEDGVTSVYKYLYDSSSELKGSAEHVENLASLIVDDQPSPFDRLIEHLEDMQKEEHNTLTDLAIEMAELRVELPFDSLGQKLIQKQNEYFLMQQRVFGIIDTIEEVKAIHEGFYINGNND